MKRLIAIIIFALTLPFFSSAQSNYKPGYVITLKGDTLHGFIDYQEWDANPTSINFKTDSTLKASKKLTTDDISFFNVNNIETYQKYSGRISIDRIDADHVNNGKDTSFKIASVFLKILEKGDKVTLLYYIDGIRPHLYVAEKIDATPVELSYSIYIVEDEKTGNGKTVNDNVFKRQLYALAQKYNMLTDRLQIDIQHADYKKSDILKIVSKINNMTESEFTTRYSSKGKSTLFVTAGLNITNTFTIATSPYYAAGGKSYTSNKAAVSVGADFFVNPNTQKLFFRMEAGLAQSNYNVTYIDKIYPADASQASFDEFWISFAPQIGYNLYNGDNFKFYIAVGIAFTFYQQSNAFYGSPSFSQNFVSGFPYNFSPFDSPLILKAGIQFSKRIGIYATYLTSVRTTRGGYYALNKNADQIGIKYNFK